MRREKTTKLAVLAVFFMMFSCVTINIYFPAEKVNRVADEIAKEVRGKEVKEKPAPQPKSEKEGRIINIRFAGFFAPREACAAEATEVSNAVIRSIKERMKERFALLVPFFDAGNIGENNEGFLSLRNVSGLSVKQRARLNKLVKAENKDREALYAEVAKALNIAPDQVSRVAKIFAGKWHETCRKGWWIQLDDGTWTRKQ